MVDITEHPSPNFGPRRHGHPPDMVVLHYTGMASAQAALTRLCDPACEVSAHYLVTENGHVFRLVPEAQRAWHAGAGQWGEITDVNSHSIGIELANTGPLDGFPAYPTAQMTALQKLLTGILGRWHILPAHVIGHSDMAVSRKIDPGPKFDWYGLAQQGLSIWPELPKTDIRPDAVGFLAAAGKFGYQSTPADCAAVLRAFRLRFFPEKSGPLDHQDMGAITSLANRFKPPAAIDPAQ